MDRRLVILLDPGAAAGLVREGGGRWRESVNLSFTQLQPVVLVKRLRHRMTTSDTTSPRTVHRQSHEKCSCSLLQMELSSLSSLKTTVLDLST